MTLWLHLLDSHRTVTWKRQKWAFSSLYRAATCKQVHRKEMIKKSNRIRNYTYIYKLLEIEKIEIIKAN